MKIDGIIVVEGKTDVTFLSSFIDAEFITTNGSEISKETILFLKESSKSRNTYVLTDPDFPGERIRKILDQNINGLNHCFIKKENSIKRGKVGVAESTKEEILLAFKNITKVDKTKQGDLKMDDLIELGLSGSNDSSQKRNKICKQLQLGHCNAKTFLKRLNYRGINIDDIKKIL